MIWAALGVPLLINLMCALANGFLIAKNRKAWTEAVEAKECYAAAAHSMEASIKDLVTREAIVSAKEVQLGLREGFAVSSHNQDSFIDLLLSRDKKPETKH